VHQVAGGRLVDFRPLGVDRGREGRPGAGDLGGVGRDETQREGTGCEEASREIHSVTSLSDWGDEDTLRRFDDSSVTIRAALVSVSEAHEDEARRTMFRYFWYHRIFVARNRRIPGQWMTPMQ